MTTHSEVTASDQQAETWKPLPPPFTKDEWSPDGYGPDQKPVRRAGAVTGLATTVNNHGGYLMVKPYRDDGKRQTVPVHTGPARRHRRALPARPGIVPPR